MECENVQVKLEPCEEGEGSQEGSVALELQTEDGETIVIKQEKDDEEDDSTVSDSLNRSPPVRIKKAKTSEPKSFLRRALIDLTEDDLPQIKKEPLDISETKTKQGKSVSEKGVKRTNSADDDQPVKKIKVEKDAPACKETNAISKTVENKSNSGKTSSERGNSSNLVVSENAAKVLFKAAADIGSKDKAEKSNKIKIVFDLSGKLKEWRVEPKSTDSTMPASNLGKILMFANMMKNQNSSDSNNDKALPNLAKLQAELNAKTAKLKDGKVPPNLAKLQAELNAKTSKSKDGKVPPNLAKLQAELNAKTSKSKGGKVPPNLAKLQAEINAIKTKAKDETVPPNLAKLQAEIYASKSKSKPSSFEKISQMLLMPNEDAQGGVVDADFQGFKCKTCGKEFLNKMAMTSHMKLHHLSLSGLPGSTPEYCSPRAAQLKAVKSPGSSAKKRIPATATSTMPTQTQTKSSSSSISPKLLQQPRPVTLVSSKAITQINPADSAKSKTFIQNSVSPETSPPKTVPPKTAPNKPVSASKSTPVRSTPLRATKQVAMLLQDLPDSAVDVLTGDSAKQNTKEAASADTETSEPEASSSKAELHRCDVCDKEYSRYAALQQHMRIHTMEKPFMCGICDNSYFLYTDLESHLLNHSDPNQRTTIQFTCSQCDEEFETEEDLQIHLKSHGDIETETVYECGMCGKELNSQMELKYHMKRHMGDPFEPCKCGVCLQSFSEVEELKKHLAEEHFKHAAYVCDYCKCRFLSMAALKKHMTIHERIRQVNLKVVHKWKCRFCIQRFEFKPDLVAHTQKAHPRNRSFDCSFCDTAFPTKEDLQTHIKTHSVVAHFL